MNRFKLIGILVLIILMVFAAGCNGEPEIAEATDALPTESATEEVVEEPEETGIVYSDNGDIHITESSVILSDIIVDGDLYIDATVGDGDFTVQDVEVTGTIYVNGGGENSGYLNNVIGNEMEISGEYGTRVVCTDTSMDSVNLLADCAVEVDESIFGDVTVGSEGQEAINVSLKGDYPEVTLESTANVLISGKISLLAVLEGAGMTSIEMVDESMVYFYAGGGESVTILGGKIIEAWINAENCTVPEDTTMIGTETDIESVKVGEEDYNIPNWSSPNAGTDADGIFVVGYPKVSRSGSVVTVAVALEKEGTVYAIIEGSEITLSEISASEIINPGSSPDNQIYIPINGNVSVEVVGEMYVFTITIPGDNFQGRAAVFIVAVDVDGNQSTVYRVVD